MSGSHVATPAPSDTEATPAALPPLPTLTAVVLADDAEDLGVAAALSTLGIADRVVIVARGEVPEVTAEFDVVAADWQDPNAGLRTLLRLPGDWLLVVADNELLVIDDPVSAKLAVLDGQDAMGVTAGSTTEVRFIRRTVAAVGRMGAPTDVVVPGISFEVRAPRIRVEEPDLGERHMVIVWENARAAADAIAEDVAERFVLRSRLDMSWSAEHFENNLSRFYGQKLPLDSHKAQHIGTGPFHVLLFEDPEPRYAPQMTSSGVDVVNLNVFEAKANYREATGGGHRIHGTTTAEETAHDATLLLGLDVDSWYQPAQAAPRDLGVLDLIGANGWTDLRELFAVLDRTVTYVVMRNFEEMPDDMLLDGHDDIDLLVRERDETAFILNAQRAFPEAWRTHYYVPIAGTMMPFDLRYVGDAYYPLAMQEEMLASRTRVNGCFWAPPEVQYFNTLLYHALVHKPGVADDYRVRLSAMAAELTCAGPRGLLTDAQLVGLLARWLQGRSWEITRAFDRSVYFNDAVHNVLHNGAEQLWADAAQGAATWR